MIHTSVFITTVISLCICFILPLGYLFAVEKRRTNVLRPYWIGALAFFIAQVILRLPLLNVLRTGTSWYAGLQEENIWLYALFVSFTTALLETLARYIFIRLTLQDRNRFIDAVSMGVGHGLVESVLFTGVTLLGLFFYFICINTNTLAEVSGLSGTALEELQNQCMSMTAMDMFILGLERLSSMAMQVGYTVMVYKGVKSKNLVLIPAAMLWQVIPNMIVVLFPDFGIGDIGIQIAYVVLGALGIFYVYSVRNHGVWKLKNEQIAESLSSITRRKL